MSTQIPPAGYSGSSGTGEQTGTTEQAKETVQELAGQAKEQAQQATEKARNRAQEQVDQRSTEYGQKLTDQASDARSVAEELRKQGKDQPAKLAEQAADKADQLGGYLQRADADQMLRDIEDFGRRRPWVVVAGGLAVGFAASRFLKASSAERARNLPARPVGPARPNGRPQLEAPDTPMPTPTSGAGRGMPGTTGGL